ncbi:MAG: hypothetical protein O7B35_16285 [Deltaproteobacteria bacterium]|nr:hypothetical protein [Deltaproteobacteria bacterium]
MILCDLDKVLATSRGMDTTYGERIHRTFVQLPLQLQIIREAGIPFHIVTTKTEAEAWEVLRTIGLDKHVTSVIGANALLWPSVWSALKNGRIPVSISKAFYGRAIPNNNSGRVVMIEDQRNNLNAMFEAGCIDVGILVPQVSVVENRVVEWFDLDLVLRVARELVTDSMNADELARLGLKAYRCQTDGLKEIDIRDLKIMRRNDRYLIEMPIVSALKDPSSGIMLQSLDTGYTLTTRRLNVVTALRTGRQTFLRVTAALSGRS